MDNTTRWETAAIRTGSRARNQPPRPSAKRPGAKARWVTLKEAEAATGIPVNTLRKWARKSDLPSYLESDGDIALRMLDLDAVFDRARRLGRTVAPMEAPVTTEGMQADEPDISEPAEPHQAPAEATMIVPIDAWNKMLSQLGNLHEAGQQLAEARERAAKAETEATFLRQRLAEIRVDTATEDADTTTTTDVHIPDVDEPETPQPTAAAVQQETTTYWRYLTTGWRDRQRRRARPD